MSSVRSKLAGWLIAPAAILIAALLWWLYNAHPLSLLLTTAIYALGVALPGRIVFQRLVPNAGHLRGWVFGSILGEIILGILLKITGSSLLAGLILPILAVGLWLTRDKASPKSSVETHPVQIAAICAAILAFLGFFLYGQAYNAGEAYHFGYNPTVDLSYFQTVLNSISTYGSSRDLAQLGYHFNYPDLGYQVFSFVHRLSGAEAFDMLFFFAPFKDFLLLSLGLYCFLEDRVEQNWVAAIAAIGFYIFNSRSLLELNVPITNPAYREGLYFLFFLLWAYQFVETKRRWLLVTAAMIGLVLVKPAIWIIAATALFVAQAVTSIREKRYVDLAMLILVLAATGSLFVLLFGPAQSGLASGHYSIIFGEGLSNTIDALSKLSDSVQAWKDIVIRPLSELSIGAVLLGLLLFIPFLLQGLQQAGRLILLAIAGFSRSTLDLLDNQLLWIILVCFAVLGFVGMEYASFLHVYLTPLLLTATTILLAITYRRSSSKLWRGVQVLLLLVDVAFAAYGYHNERSRTASVQVPSALIDEMRSIRRLTDTSSVIATYETGLFQRGDERSYLAAAFTERKILSEGAIYGSLIMGYHENVKGGVTSPVGDTLLARRSAVDSIYRSSDPSSVRNAATRYGVTHILIRHGQGERITSPVGDTIFHGKMLTLLKL